MNDECACAHCGHLEKDHCRGNQEHAGPKTAQTMSGRGNVVCVGRHCNHPLCDCVAFIGA